MIVRAACDEIVDQFLRQNKIVADHKMTFMERASLRSECRKLTRFLRLTDFIVVDTLRDLALDSVLDAVSFVRPLVMPERAIRCVKPAEADDAMGMVVGDDAAAAGGDGATPLFTVNASFGGDGRLSLSPSLQRIQEAFSEVITQSLKVIGIPERVFTHAELAAYVMAESDDADDLAREETPVQDFVSTDDTFRRTTEKIYTHLDGAFGEVRAYVERFAPYKATFFENSGYVDNIREIYKDVDLKVYKAEIEKYGGQVGEFEENIPYSADIGVFHVDSEELKMKLMPSPVACLYALKSLLPELMDAGFASLLDELQTVLPVVMGSPTTVETFVEKKKVVAEAIAAFESFKARQQKLIAMAELMESQSWPLPDEQKANLVMAEENMSTLETGMQIAEGREEEDTKRFAEEIKIEVPQLQKKIVAVREMLDKSLIADDQEDPSVVIEYLDKQEDALNLLKARAHQLQDYQTILGQDVDEYETLDEVSADLGLKMKLWNGLREWARLTTDWVGTALNEVNVADLEKEVVQYNRTVYQASKGLPNNPVVPKLKAGVDEFTPVLPVVVNLRNPSLQDRHWELIHDLTGITIKGDASFTLGDIVAKGVSGHHEQITVIATNATQEAVLEEMMAKVTNAWEGCEFEVKPYKDVKDLYALGDVSEIIASLDECLVTVNTVLGSRYVAGIRDFVEKWRRDLILFQETLDEWLMVQRAWMYLETIFSSPDIVRQLPAAAKMFQAIDKSWRAIMKATNDDPLALKACCVKDRKETLQSHNAGLDKIQKSLEEYLETKRAAFPRFYFLSNDELLEILSQAKDPHAVQVGGSAHCCVVFRTPVQWVIPCSQCAAGVKRCVVSLQPHLRKCFECLVKIEFATDDPSVVVAMFSPENERVELGKNLRARGNVEEWLKALEDRSKLILHGAMKIGLEDYDTKQRKDWVDDHPGQVVASVAQMTWARDTEAALKAPNPLDEMKVWYQTNLVELDNLIVKIRSDLTKLQRSVICALVTTDVHARDIIDELVHDKVDSVMNFKWVQQLRYYWEKPAGGSAEDLFIRHSDALIDYGYEYMGATSRLVITPLTDRCWMTLTASYGLKLGGAPAGPAGTGKTESSKDLAKAMAIQCVVFNCSDQIDYKMMGKLFRGLAQQGNWTCLDEFNRIDIEVLSVIAQQLLVLRQGRLLGQPTLNFMGIEIKLLDHHVIITMNPGYAGRTELPDNLQVCFRPVAMMVPNYALIAEIMLFAEGFGDAKTLSRKMCKLYILCSEQLSQQPHYDYGLRAVKSVLVMAGGLKRANPDLDEDLVLIRALRDSNVPKFLADDLPLFAAIVNDLFPGVDIPPNDYGEFQVAMEEEIAKAGLQQTPGFHKKIIQMYDIFCIRFGATLVGPTGSGKSSVYRVLASTMTNLRARGSPDQNYQEVAYRVLNPKCIRMGELYGEVNMMTQEWVDGLASTIMREAVNDDTITRKWTVFDGPIDAIWIENMNTVLDDNMTLCLANGERIKLKVEMKMLFEVMDLAVASPATVSRIGVVYLTPESTIGWFPRVQSFAGVIDGISQAQAQLPEAMPLAAKWHFVGLFDKLFQKGLDFSRKQLKEPVGCVDIQLANSCLVIFQSLFTKENGVDLAAFAKDVAPLLKLIDKLFAFAFIWSIGGSVDAPSQEKFDYWARERFDEAGLALQLPPSNTVYDYFVDAAQDKFRDWNELVDEFTYSPAQAYTAIMVPTTDTTKFGYLMRSLITVNKPVFMTGVTGTGKTVAVQNLLRKLEAFKEDGGLALVPVFVSFSAQTSSLVTQLTIENKLEKKRKNLLGAPAGRKVVIFVDDINMPITEEYGAQPPVELLRQFLDFQGFYDREKLFWKDIVDTMLFTGAAPPGGGRSEVTPRFTRHYNVFCVPPTSNDSMAVIFRAIVNGFLGNKFEDEVKKLGNGMVAGAIEVFNRISTELLPTPAKFHYTFNLRDISKVFQGILMVDSKKCKEAITMVRLWIHECMRVFYDRLINTDDQAWFECLMAELATRHMGHSESREDMFEKGTIIFCDFLKPGAEVTFYEYAPDLAKVESLLDDCLEEYNVEHPTRMNLVFFRDAVMHTTRMSRILRQPRGNAMLVGVGGSGKQSTTRMAAHIAHMECLGIEINRGYGLENFREDFKKFMIRTGVEGLDTVFLFTDSQVINNEWGCYDM